MALSANPLGLGKGKSWQDCLNVCKDTIYCLRYIKKKGVSWQYEIAFVYFSTESFSMVTKWSCDTVLFSFHFQFLAKIVCKISSLFNRSAKFLWGTTTLYFQRDRINFVAFVFKLVSMNDLFREGMRPCTKSYNCPHLRISARRTTIRL